MSSFRASRILLDIPESEVESVEGAIRALAPNYEIRAWDPRVPPRWADCLLTWAPETSRFRCLAPDGFIQAYGAGVDRIVSHPDSPPGVAIGRLVDETMSAGMAQHIVHAVLHWFRFAEIYRQQQARREWRRHPHPHARDCGIGIFGMGSLGSYLADTLTKLDFPVRGWRRSAGDSRSLGEFLAGSRILICLTPLTDETRGIIDAAFLAQLPRGSFLINCSRGGVLNERDLLQALDQGHLSGAALDVFTEEPLPADSPLWSRENLFITPHIATFPSAPIVATHVVTNCQRHLRGEPLLNPVDVLRGY